MAIFDSPLGHIKLKRFPILRNDKLRAWDAADELLLKHCWDNQLLSDNINVLIINDHYGALTSSLLNKYSLSVDNWSDSLISHEAVKNNLANNTINQSINYIKSTEQPTGCYDLVLIRLPKTIALLETQLNGLGEKLKENCQIIAAGMCKHMPKSVYNVFERLVGETQTSLAEKKARLIFTKNDSIPLSELPYPITYHQKELDITLSNNANVFSKEQLDIGARFFIEQFVHITPKEHAIDLGCGNGVLGVMATKTGVAKNIHFVDESYMALCSAKMNYIAEFGSAENCQVHPSESLSHISDIKADLILCNPPFHQQHQVGEHIAKRMFKQSHEQLNNSGELWVVANKHLGYYPYLKRIFNNCTTIASNKKFNIYKCVKS